MKNSTFTPGPWTYLVDDSEKSGNFKGYIHGDIGGCIAHVWPDRETPTGRDNTEGNARLIAASPEIADLLLETLISASMPESLRDDIKAALQKAGVLSKAEGGGK
jgi:hypothetical protein